MRVVITYNSSLSALAFFILLLSGGCKKDKGASPVINSGTPDIYTAGYLQGSTAETPVYWKNGVVIDTLPTPAGFTGVRPTCIAVVGSDVYIGGIALDDHGYLTALYWKNNVPVLLDNGARGSFVSAAAVSGANVYFSGSVTQANAQTSTPAYWKNGSVVYLPVTDTTPSFTRNIAVYGEDVYVTATGSTYWKNGSLVSTNIKGSIEALAISGSDTYYAGTSGYPNAVATYWKNGQAVVLDEPQGAETRPSDAYAISVSGSDVYILGFGFVGATNSYTNRYWVDGKRVELNNGGLALQATGIAAIGDTVYVSGSRSAGINTTSYIGCYWKNGEPTDFPDDPTEARPLCIFAVQYAR